ncbi:MAG TPA: DUF1844 domain-containing protein [Thermoanaerobaculia bacterium]|nr:DUF1844 domain-containing protein [Thermoanaerobaculia bacterium]
MSDDRIQVTDKRMFTSDGRLREEFKFLESPPAEPAAAGEPVEPGPAERVETAAPAAWQIPAEPAPAAESARLELPGTPPGLGRPTFYDLVSLLEEPVALYLGDLPLPTGESAENLEMARLHIDLLDVLRQKTAGNLSAQEAAFLDDLLYRSRVRYVQKRG